MPGRRLVIVAEETAAVLAFLWNVSRLPTGCAVTRVRLDACMIHQPSGRNTRCPDQEEPRERWRAPWGPCGGLYLPSPRSRPGFVLMRNPHGPDESTALPAAPNRPRRERLVEWLVWRWTVDGTIPEVCAPLGVEMQHHWSGLAILRTTLANARPSFRS